MIERENIVCFSSVDWDHMPTSKKHIMSILAKKNRVLYVETLGSRPPSLRPVHIKRLLKRWINWIRGIRRVKGLKGQELILYSPINIYIDFSFFSLISKGLTIFSFKRLLKKLGIQKPILWFYIPNPVYLIGRLGEKAVIYHCVDEWSTYPGGKHIAFQRLEQKLTKLADLVFVVSKTLLEKKIKLNPKTYYLPHGSDFDFFHNADLSRRSRIPEDIANIKRPIIGMIGDVASWVDIDLLIYTATTHPEWSIVFIGPVSYDFDIKKIAGIRNVHILGLKPYEELPNYYQIIDVCIIAFRPTEHITYCNPTRIYEYLSTGKPIVSTDFPAAREIPEGFIYIAKGKEEFVHFINVSLNENLELSEKRKELAYNNRWELRVEGMSALIDKTLKEKLE